MLIFTENLIIQQNVIELVAYADAVRIVILKPNLNFNFHYITTLLCNWMLTLEIEHH